MTTMAAAKTLRDAGAQSDYLNGISLWRTGSPISRGIVEEKSPSRRNVGRVLLVLAVAFEVPVVSVPILYCIGLASVLFVVPSLLASKAYRWLMVLAIVATAATAAVVTYNGLPLVTVLEASSTRIVIYSAALVFFSRAFVLRRADLIVCAALGVAGLWVQTNQLSSFETLWKYVLFVPASLLILSFFQTSPRTSRQLGYGALVAIAAACALAALRSGAIEIVVVAAATFIHGFKAISTQFKAMAAVSVSIAFILVAVYVIPALGESGVFGSTVQASFRADSTSGGGAVLGGRSELPVSLATASVAPLAGHGLVPVATTEILTRAGRIAESLGMNPDAAVLRTWYAPNSFVVSAHSVVMEMWITSGIAGLLLGCYCAFVLARKLLRDLRNSDPISLAVTFLMVVLLWDLAFSPMLAGRDVLLALGLLVALSKIATPADLDSAPIAKVPGPFR